MAKIRFWRWQHTDQFGMPGPSRFRISDVEREGEGVKPLEQHPWSLETWNLKRSSTDIARSAAPK